MSKTAAPLLQEGSAVPRRTEKARLGELLLAQGLISKEQLQQGLEQQRSTGKKLGRLLIDTGILT